MKWKLWPLFLALQSASSESIVRAEKDLSFSSHDEKTLYAVIGGNLVARQSKELSSELLGCIMGQCEASLEIVPGKLLFFCLFFLWKI